MTCKNDPSYADFLAVLQETVRDEIKKMRGRLRNHPFHTFAPNQQGAKMGHQYHC